MADENHEEVTATPEGEGNQEEGGDEAGKLYIGNLAFKTTEEGLREAFQEHGEISFARVISDRFSGRSRGFGFVTFANKEDAEAAVQAKNETELDGRTIRVNFAQPRDPDAPRPRRNFRGRGRGGRGRGRGRRGGRGEGEGGDGPSDS